MASRRGWLRRGFSLVSALALAFSLVPAAALAQAPVAPDSSRAASELCARVSRAARVQALDVRQDAYEPAEIIVTYRDGAAPDALALDGASQSIDNPVATIEGARGQALSDAGADGDAPLIAQVEVPAGLSVGEAVAAAEDDPAVAHAQPNWRYYALEDRGLAPAALASDAEPRAVAVNDEYAQSSVNDKTQKNQWWLSAVRAPDAWEYARCEGDVTVAVLDTGINFEHEDLKDNICTEYAWDAVAGEKLTDSVRQNALAHGCHVAGIVTGKANNSVGVAGVSYDAQVLPIAVFTASGSRASCDDATLIKAYSYLMSDPNPDDGTGRSVIERTNLHVVNMSLGGYGGMDSAFEAMIAKAELKGVLTVAAGGNGDDNGDPLTDNSYPSDYDEVMSVVALQGMAERTYWSDYNNCKDIAAPGADIWSTWYTSPDAYYCTSGTSMAAPVVAGCAALLWKYDPQLTVAQVKDALYSTAVDLGEPGKDDYYGWGRIDAAAAIESLGTAHISVERQTMGRTGTQQLSASDVKNPGASHEWVWSIDSQYAEFAEIDAATGVLTAKEAGSAVVDVVASDDPSINGHAAITITEITVPGTVGVISDGVKHRVTLEWSAADAAVKYNVLRGNAKAGSYDVIATVAAASGMKTHGYTDSSVQAGRDYYYVIEPVGQLGGADVSGQRTAPVRGYFSDKATLSARISAAQALVDAAVVSVDGSDIAQSVKWTTAENRDALAEQVARGNAVMAAQYARQAVVDSVADDLQEAIEAYNSALAPGTKPTAKPTVPKKASIARATVTLDSASKPYTGKPQAGSVKKVVLGGKALKAGADYTVSAKKGTVPGRYAVTVKGAGSYTGTATAAFTIAKAAGTLKVAVKAPKVKFSKKKARTVKAQAAYSITGAQGSLSFAGAGKSKLSVDKKTGAIKVPKKLKRGAYKITVNVTAAGNANYKPATRAVTVKVKVK